MTRRALTLLGAAALMLTIAAFGTACGIEAEEGPEGAEAAAASVPSSLSALESGAEDLVDAALAHDRDEVTATAARLRGAAGGSAAATLREAGVPAATIARVQRRAESVTRLAPRAPFVRVALAANAVSGLMPELYARFDDPVPPSVLALDYLDREAQLRSLVDEQSKVGKAVARLASTWARLRPKLVSAGKVEPAEAFDEHVAAMKHAVRGSPEKIQAEAVHGLALVDGVENAFRR